MRLREVMRSEVIAVPAEVSIREAAKVMEENDCGFLPIVGEGGVAIGVVTGRDLAIRATARNLSFETTPVSAVMSRPPVIIQGEGDLEEATILMRQRHVHRLLITDADGRLVGVVTLADLAGNAADQSITKTLQRHAEESHPGLRHEYVYNVPGLYMG